MGLLSNVQIASGLQAGVGNTAASTNTNSTVNNSKASQPTVGAGAGQVNKIYDGQVNIVATGTPATLDLSALTDPQNVAIAFTKVYSIQMTAVDNSGNNITVGGGTNGLFATMVVPLTTGVDAGAFHLNFGSAGLVVDGTHKILQFAIPAGANVKVNVTIVGQ